MFRKTYPRRRVIELFAASAALAAAPARASAAKTLHRWSGAAMGAEASFAIRHEDPNEAARLITLARDEIARLEAMFSLYRSDSALSRLNREGRLINPPTDFLELMSICDSMTSATGGAFDPAVQSLWAYHAETAAGARPADDAEFARRLAASGWRHVNAAPDELSFSKPGCALTLNGIAQGFATDKVAALLRANGLSNVLVSVGEIAAFGERAPGAPWRVGLRHFPETRAGEEVTIRDGAIATSAPLATTFDETGRLGHILDPKTGEPAASAWRQISVLHPSAAIADGLSTGMTLMARAAIEQVADHMRNVRVIAFDHAGEKIQLGAA